MPPDTIQAGSPQRLALPSLPETRCSDSQGRDTHAEGPPGRDGLAIPKSPAHVSQSRRGDLTCSPAHPITPRDRELLNALDDPATIDPVEYAEWIKRPEIQEAIAARDNLRAREEHAKLTRFRDRVLAEASAALDTLKAVLSCHQPCHRQAPSGDSLPSSTPSTKLVGAEPPSDRQLLEARRAATSITRLAQACLRPIPCAPLGGAGRLGRPVGALSSRGFSTASTGRVSASGQSPTASSQQPPHPSPPSRIPASRVPGLEAAIGAFLRAVRPPSTPEAAAPLIANYKTRDLGDNLVPWLVSRATPLRAPNINPTRVVYSNRYDAAYQFVEITAPDGTHADCVIQAVLERHPDRTPARWAIEDVKPDTS